MQTYDVEMEGVTKRFGQVVAVRNFSIQVSSGEFLCLLGPSGCGKTTLLRMIAGLEKPTEGFIRLSNEVVNGVPPYERDTAMVFQNWALFPHKSVSDNIGFGLKMRGVPKEERFVKVQEYLDLVRLPGVEERMPSQLSGGQQQRVALARALIVEPKVLLMDEPLSNLDLKLRQQMRFEIKQIQQRLGITTIFVTHDQAEALELGDRLAVLDLGETQQIGPPADMYERPQTTFVADFIGETNFLSGTVVSVNADTSTVKTAGGLSIEVTNNLDLKEGAEASVSVRPEQLRVYTNEGETPENCFKGKVLMRTYTGVSIRYHIDLDETSRVFIDRPNSPDERVYSVGDEITVGWGVEGTTCFATESG